MAASPRLRHALAGDITVSIIIRTLSFLIPAIFTITGDGFPGTLLPVQGVDSNALEAVTSSFYSGSCNVTASNVSAIYDTAVKLEAQSLAEACRSFVISSLTADNCCAILSGAMAFKQSALIAACHEFSASK